MHGDLNRNADYPCAHMVIHMVIHMADHLDVNLVHFEKTCARKVIRNADYMVIHIADCMVIHMVGAQSSTPCWVIIAS